MRLRPVPVYSILFYKPAKTTSTKKNQVETYSGLCPVRRKEEHWPLTFARIRTSYQPYHTFKPFPTEIDAKEKLI